MKRIRPEIREYILSDVNMVLTRLGVSDSAKEIEEFYDKYNGQLLYKFETPAIKQYPMMFKKAYVDGYMVASEIKEDSRFYELSEKNDIVCVILDWRWESFRRGSNGTDLGRIIYAVRKDLPDEFIDITGHDIRELCVRKLESIEL